MTGSCLSAKNLGDFNEVSRLPLSDGVVRQDLNVHALRPEAPPWSLSECVGRDDRPAHDLGLG